MVVHHGGVPKESWETTMVLVIGWWDNKLFACFFSNILEANLLGNEVLMQHSKYDNIFFQQLYFVEEGKGKYDGKLAHDQWNMIP